MVDPKYQLDLETIPWALKTASDTHGPSTQTSMPLGWLSRFCKQQGCALGPLSPKGRSEDSLWPAGSDNKRVLMQAMPRQQKGDARHLA